MASREQPHTPGAKTRATVLAVVVGVLAVLLAASGCKAKQAPYYHDPAGRFEIGSFQSTEDGVDAKGTAFRHADIDVAIQGGGVQRVRWQEEEYTDGSPDNWKWTLTDVNTGVRRIYRLSTAWRRFSVSDGSEEHTTSLVHAGRQIHARLDGALRASVDEACSALSATALCAATPAVFGYLRAGLLAGRLAPSRCVLGPTGPPPIPTGSHPWRPWSEKPGWADKAGWSGKLGCDSCGE